MSEARFFSTLLDTSYAQIHDLQKKQFKTPGYWVPHFVTVGNRKVSHMTQGIWLSSLIELILKKVPTMSHFYCLMCRNIPEDPADVLKLLKFVGE